jgi:RNA polymerase sigma factor (sigma-70 family)
MTAGPLTTLLGYLRRRAGEAPGQGSDGSLLRCFAIGRDEEAFATLVGRHGPMVLEVCRRVLEDSHHAEDAFQATFFILARKAGAIRKGDSVASWLYGVAVRVALKMKATAARRRAHERQVVVVDEPDPAVEVARAELRPVLDEELGRLPESYRAPLVLCYLEGKTNEQAARELGWPKGTVAGRLARARELLRGRLRRRGLALSSGLLAALLGESAATAAVPATLAGSTIQAAGVFATGTVAVASASAPAALAEGVLQTMMLTRIKIAAVLLVVCVCGTGAGVLAQRAGPGPALAAAGDADKDRAAEEAKRLKAELLKLRDELARTRAELEATKREAERQRQLAEQQRRRAEEAAAQALDALRRAQAERERAEAERQRALVEARRAEEAARAAARAAEQGPEKKAEELARAWLAKKGFQWGKPSAVRPASQEQAKMVGGGKATFLVVYPTPAREKALLGDRAVVVNTATGKVVAVPRE